MTVLHGTNRRIAELIVNIEKAQLMARQFDTLSHLSDDQLAERGLTRPDIPWYVWSHSVHA